MNSVAHQRQSLFNTHSWLRTDERCRPPGSVGLHSVMYLGRRAFVMVAIAGCLSGCSTITAIITGHKPYLIVVTAKPIDQSVIDTAEAAPPATVKNAIGKVLVKSEQSCDEFTKKLSIANVGSNTALDIATTVFSAAATAVTSPLSAVHGLTAASTISSGSKTAIDSDIFAKATIANMAQAIKATYYKDLATYEAELGTEQADSIVPSVEVAKILSIHNECALDSAEASISSTLGGSAPPAASPPPTTGKLVSVSLPGGHSHAGDVVQLIATSGKDPTLKLTANYTVIANDTAQDIAKGLVASIQGDKGFSQASITASLSPPPGDSSFVVQSPTASEILLGLGSSPPSDEKLTITDAKSTSPTTPSTGTHGFVPGHPL
jgi:hypothetical protein